ncbi:MAG: hypothetical protein A3G77_03480 [Acidobacteria bacterium RIFCSPLOWO2_12_FULL_68_19]|nr:MAG: hypothetical protein A3G77_03480 [Acidobacteria bacterium RIFCSPLOWO2_12_FULL_68_19]
MSIDLSSLRHVGIRVLAAPAAWSAYIVLPARGWGWLDGVPLGWFEAAALALVWWTWATGRHLPGMRVLAALAVAKLVLGAAFVDRGFVAQYYANDTWTPPAERSIEFRSQPFTWRDERLWFGSTGAPDLPLYFYNNVRWNYYQPTEPKRDRLAYSAEWTGFLRTDTASADATFYVDGGPGVSAELSVDGRPVIARDAALPRTGSVRVGAGWHALTVRVKAPYGSTRRFEAGEIVNGTRRPFDASRVSIRPVGAVRRVVDTTLRWTTGFVDAAILLWLGLLVLQRARHAARELRIGRLLWLVAIMEALWFAAPHIGRMTVLSGGNDWLMYEHLSRAIALGDPLLRQPGPGGGQGSPLYFQPLYPYFLALSHLSFGEGLFGAILVQRLLLVAAIGWAAAMTRHAFGQRAGWIALIGGGAFLYAKAGRWTNVLLSEPFFMPLLVGWAALLVALASGQPSWRQVGAAGVVGGIATLTRPTLLAAWPPILLLWWASLRSRRGGRYLTGLLIVLLAVVNLLTIRNWIVADRFIFSPTSFGPSLYAGNEPTRPLDEPPAGRAIVYERLGLDGNVRRVAEFALQAPGDFVRGLGNKALYTVGFFGWSGLDGGIGISWLYVGMWVLAGAGAIRILAASPAPLGPAVWLPAAGALSHAAAVVLVFPHGYTDRLIVPLYPLLIPYAAFAVEPVLPAFLLAAARLRGVPQLAAAWIRRHIIPIARPILRERRHWTYLAYTGAVIQWQQGLELLTALLLPATALAVARVTRHDLLHRLAAGAVWTAALTRVAMAGSQSAEALHDPLFWGLVAAAAVALSAATGRWPVVAMATAAVGGACTTTALLLLGFGGVDASFPDLRLTTAGQSLDALFQQFGPLGALCLIGVCVQAVLPRGAGGFGTGRIAAAARGALAAGFVLALAGAVPGPGVDARLWLVSLGILLGLVEARAR